MLSRIEVTNFQSLHHVDIALGRFTVIVGRTDSGKSAFIRALRTLTSNQRGDSFITRGERLTTITAHTPAHTVTLCRGTTNSYTITPTPHDTTPAPAPQVFTKLNGTTPPEVSTALGIPATDPLNYATQFDTPYLLKAPAPEVARTLGDLTNVRIIFDAARESNRRRLAAGTTHKTRVADLATIRTQAQSFAGLSAQLAAIERAELALTTARTLQARLERLTQAATALDTLTARLTALEPLADQAIPNDQPLASAYTRQLAYTNTIDRMRRAATAYQDASAREVTASDELVALADAYVSALNTAGVCPTCGQDTHGLAHVDTL